MMRGVYIINVEHPEGVDAKRPLVLGTVAHSEGLSCRECWCTATRNTGALWVRLHLVQCFLENRPSIYHLMNLHGLIDAVRAKLLTGKINKWLQPSSWLAVVLWQWSHHSSWILLRPSQWYIVDKSYDPDSNPELLLLFHSGNTLMEQDTTVRCPAGTLVS